jgi:hypothetical protein
LPHGRAIASRNYVVREPVASLASSRVRDGSGGPVFGERRELQFVGCGPGALAGEKSDGLGDLVWVGECVRCHSGTSGAAERLDTGVDDQECDLDPVGAELEGGSVGDCLDSE